MLFELLFLNCCRLEIFTMKKHLLLIVCCCLTTLLTAQSNVHFGGRSAGMAHASVTLSDVWSTHHNQAGLAWIKNPLAGVYYQNRFMISELSNIGLAYAHPIKKGTFALQWSNFGYSLYQENKVGLAYAMKFSEKLSGGVQINYLNTRLGGVYGSKNSLVAELGLQAKLTNKLSIGAHVYNPTQTRLNNYNKEAILTKMRIGIDYSFSEKLIWVIETEKDIDYNAYLKTGIEYKTNDKLIFRGGMSTGLSVASFGFGLNMEQYNIDIAAAYHQVIGFSPEISFTYNFNKKK